MKKEFFVLILLLTLILAFFVRVHAQTQIVEWTRLYQWGTWDTCTLTKWSVPKSNTEGEARWIAEVNNFSAFYANIRFSSFDSYNPEWWHPSWWKEVRIYWNITGSFGNILVVLVYTDEQGLWGVTDEKIVHARLIINGTSNDVLAPYPASQCQEERDYFDTHVPIEVFIHKVSSDQTRFVILSHDKVPPIALIDHTINVDITNATWIFTIKHSGSGWFEGSMDMYFEYYPIPNAQPAQPRNIWDLFWRNLQDTGKNFAEPIKGFFSTIGDWFTVFFSFIGPFIWNIAYYGVQFFPLIFLFWFLDAIITAIHEGNLQPLGYAFQTIYNTLARIANTIVNIANTIWDYITFWS